VIDVIYNVPDVDVNKNPLQVVRVTMWTGIILGFLGFTLWARGLADVPASESSKAGRWAKCSGFNVHRYSGLRG